MTEKHVKGNSGRTFEDAMQHLPSGTEKKARKM
jgi:hypothetical protein